MNRRIHRQTAVVDCGSNLQVLSRSVSHSTLTRDKCRKASGLLLANFGFLLSALCCLAGGVVNSADEASLRAALAGGGTVTFSVDGTIALSSPLIITNDTTIDGSGHSIIISGSSSVRVFQVNSGVLFTLLTLTVANGRTNVGAGVLNAGGSVLVSNCVFTNNQVIGATGSGGAFPGPGESVTGGAIYNAGVLVLLNSSLMGNVAGGGTGGGPTGVPEGTGARGGDGSGGAIYNLGYLSLTNISFTGNGAYGGNGGYAFGNHSPGGGGSAFGGAIFSLNGSLSASNCYFAANAATAGFAGPPVQGRQVSYRGTARGGAIYNPTGNVAIASLMVTNNTASGAPASGGGLHHGSGNLTISNAVLLKNSALADRITTGITSIGSNGWGGGFYNAGTASLTDCLISSNSVGGGAGVSGVGSGSSNGGDAKGGGVYNSGTLSLSRCALAGNSAAGGPGGTNGPSGNAYGGGVMNEGASAQLSNCTVAGNEVAGGGGNGYGGGVCNSLAITNCTFASNRASGSSAFGGNIAHLGTPSSVVNTIFWAGVPTNASGPLVDYGHNISSDSSASFGAPGSLNNTDPKLGPLGNYGGPTPTMPLLPGSPALDNADNSAAPPTDQRGRTRPYGPAADIGAFESSPPYVIVGRFFGLDVSDSILATLDGTLNTNVPSGGTFRFDGLAAGPHTITASDAQWVVAPNPLSLVLGPDVFDVAFTSYRRNTVNLASPSNGAAHIIYAGTNGQIHRLLASSNLLDWVSIATNAVGPSNYYEVFDPGSVGQPRRFYRSLSP
jgi:fibronectin-binding autotransporter adhesin